jgi:hypothetical protein
VFHGVSLTIGRKYPTAAGKKPREDEFASSSAVSREIVNATATIIF